MYTTGVPELDAMMKAIEKKTEKQLFQDSFGDVKGVPTGSIILDNALGIGGFPEGKITEIFGVEGSGKTSLALQVVGLRQAWRAAHGITNKRDLIIDLEHSITESFLLGFGIDLEQTIWSRCDTAEEALQIAVDLPKTGMIDICVFDSVDAAQSERQLKRSVGETDVGGVSKEMNFAVRQISKYDTATFIFINQIRHNPSPFGGVVTPGGNALKFYSMLRLNMLASKPDAKMPNMTVLRPKIHKTKICQPKGKDPFELYFEYGKGFDKYLDLINWGKNLGVVRFAGRAVQLNLDDEIGMKSIENTTGLTGYNALSTMLREDDEMFAVLYSRCKDIYDNPREE